MGTSIKISDFGNFTQTNAQVAVQVALNSIANRNLSAGNRELVIDRRLTFSGSIVIPNNFKLIFNDTGIIIPANDQVKGINIQNTLGIEFSLSNDVLKGKDRINVGTNATSFLVGDIIFIKSSDIIDTSPNRNNITKGQTAKIIAKDGNNLLLDNATKYNYNASNTTVGKIVGNHNVTIENYKFGEIGQQIGNTGADLRYIHNLKINTAHIENNRIIPNNSNYDLRTDEFNRQNVHGISLVGCSNPVVENITGTRLGYYLVNIDGACRDVKIKNVTGSFCRHVVSLNDNHFGEVFDYSIENIEGHNTQRAVFDTHTTGNNGYVRNIKSYNALSDGHQIRTSNITVDGFKAESAGEAGFIIYYEPQTDGNKLTNIKIKNGVCDNNGQRGISSSVAFDGDNLFCNNNGATYNVTEHCGIATNGGNLTNINLTNNNGSAIIYRTGGSNVNYKKPILLDNINAPKSTKQTNFLYSFDSYENLQVDVINTKAIGYDTDKLFSRAGSSFISSINDKNCRYGTDNLRGTALLVAGTVAVTNNNAVASAPISSTEWYTRVQAERIEAGSGEGILRVVVNNGNFVITSSNASDNGRISWWFV